MPLLRRFEYGMAVYKSILETTPTILENGWVSCPCEDAVLSASRIVSSVNHSDTIPTMELPERTLPTLQLATGASLDGDIVVVHRNQASSYTGLIVNDCSARVIEIRGWILV